MEYGHLSLGVIFVGVRLALGDGITLLIISTSLASAKT
jgi:hypothetical protein